MAPGFGPLEKLQLARGHIFKDWLATLGEKDVESRSAILEFNGLLRQAPVPTSLDSACAAVLQEIRGPWNAVTALVQTTGATAEQVIDMSALAWDDPRTDADLVIVDLCKRAWWKQQKANMWGTAAREAIALPIIERVTTTLLDHAASRDAQEDAWRCLESKADRWLQGDVRAGALDDMMLKLSRYVTDAAAQAASKAPLSQDVPWLQSLGLRARWISQRLSASMAQTTSLGPAIDQIAILTANARLSQAMSEMQALTQQDEDQELDAQATMTLFEALRDRQSSLDEALVEEAARIAASTPGLQIPLVREESDTLRGGRDYDTSNPALQDSLHQKVRGGPRDLAPVTPPCHTLTRAMLSDSAVLSWTSRTCSAAGGLGIPPLALAAWQAGAALGKPSAGPLEHKVCAECGSQEELRGCDGCHRTLCPWCLGRCNLCGLALCLPCFGSHIWNCHQPPVEEARPQEAWRVRRGLLEHPEDLDSAALDKPASIQQWPEVRALEECGYHGVAICQCPCADVD